jgi:uncharacterized protein YneF (UPF0154 family)
MTWLDFWTLLLVLTLGLFLVLAVVVAIGGFFDIRRMLRTLAKNAEKTQTDATSPEEAR